MIALGRFEVGSAPWRVAALIAGALAALSPFAEYPSALLAGPALLGGLWCAPSWGRRLELAGLFALGGALPFALGLWAHHDSWGSAFKTGYTYLENRAYVEVHKGGFFGVGAPKLEPFAGTLFSPGTGLFFFSPLLLIGLLAAMAVAARRTVRSASEISLPTERAHGAPPLDRRLAIAALVGCLFEFLFISGHSGWRGGWTVGPRYIIAVAPVLGLWAVEALRWRWARRTLPLLGAASILLTGLPAALYPHLSDVYTNPLAAFLWPSYRQGYGTYGIAHSLGLSGHAANWVHLAPLFAAALYTALSDLALRVSREAAIGAARTVIGGLSFVLLVALIPERDPAAAARENERLWGFWEPARATTVDPNLLFRARDRWRNVRVESIAPDGTHRPCRFEPGVFEQCRYAHESWHRFGPDFLEMNGVREPILFLHPIRDWRVRATIPIGLGAAKAVLKYGLADASVQSDNPTPVRIALRQGDRAVADLEATNVAGLHAFSFALTSTAPVTLELTSERDGARVFGFDLEILR